MSHITVSVFFFFPIYEPPHTHTSTPEQIPQHSPFPQVVFRKITNTYIYMCIHRQAYTCVHIICTSTHKHHSHKKRGEKKEKTKKQKERERKKKEKSYSEPKLLTSSIPIPWFWKCLPKYIRYPWSHIIKKWSPYVKKNTNFTFGPVCQVFHG